MRDSSIKVPTTYAIKNQRLLFSISSFLVAVCLNSSQVADGAPLPIFPGLLSKMIKPASSLSETTSSLKIILLVHSLTFL